MEGFLPEALRGSAVVSAAVVSDVQIAVAAVTATLIAAAVWFVVRVAIDVDVTRPRPSPPQVVAAAARAAPEPAPTAAKVVKAPATAEIATRTPSAAEAKINGKRTLGPGTQGDGMERSHRRTGPPPDRWGGDVGGRCERGRPA